MAAIELSCLDLGATISSRLDTVSPSEFSEERCTIMLEVYACFLELYVIRHASMKNTVKTYTDRRCLCDRATVYIVDCFYTGAAVAPSKQSWVMITTYLLHLSDGFTL
jgi:hypothetical protein